MKVVDLKEELKKRGLAKTGRKADLLDRLLQAIYKEQCHTPRHKEEEEEAEQAPRTATTTTTAPAAKPPEKEKKTKKTTTKEGTIKPKSKKNRKEGKEPERKKKRGPVILILDETLNGIPWEALPCLEGHPVSRLPARVCARVLCY